MSTRQMTLIAFAGLLATGAAFAHGGATGIVKERMDAMSAIGKNMKAVGQMLKTSPDVDPALVAKAGEAIAEHAGDALTELFPEGSLQKPTEASPAIWTDWTRFAAISGELQAYALDMKALADQGADKQAVAGAFGKVAGTCKTCHEAFRVKK